MADLQNIFNEIRYNAEAAEKTLWALRNRLEALTVEEQELRAGQSSSAAFISKSVAEPKPAHVDDDPVLADRCATLSRRIEETSQDLAKDREEKIRLLRTVEYRVHGGPQPTLLDQPLLDANDKLPATAGFAKVLRYLPPENVDVLSRARYFVFARAMIHSAVMQHKKNGYVNVERAALVAAHEVGCRARLIDVIATIDEQDMLKL
jgi:hypothetical protein